MNSPLNLISAEQAAMILGVSYSSVHFLRQNGHLPSTHKRGRRFMFPEADVRALAQRPGGVGPVDRPTRPLKARSPARAEPQAPAQPHRIQTECQEALVLDPVAFLRPEPGSYVPREPRAMLWHEGVIMLNALLDKPEKATRALLGKMLGVAGDDHRMVMAVIEEAARIRPHDPVPWMRAAIEARKGRRPVSVDRPPAIPSVTLSPPAPGVERSVTGPLHVMAPAVPRRGIFARLRAALPWWRS